MSLALALAACWLLGLVLGVALHLDLPVTRRLVVGVANGQLADTFRGSVRIERLDHLGLRGIDGVDLRVLDPAGHEVIRAENVRVGLDWVDTLRSVLEGPGPIRLVLTEVTVGEARVQLSTDEQGGLWLASAFELAADDRPSSEEPSRALVVFLRRITMDRVQLAGTVAGLPPLGAEATDVRGQLLVDTDELDLRLDRLHLRAEDLVREPLNAELAGRLVLPFDAERPPMVSARVDGRLKHAVAKLEAVLEGEAFDAALEVPALAPQHARALLPSWPASVPVALRARAAGELPEVRIQVIGLAGSGQVRLAGLLRLDELALTGARLAVRDVDARELYVDAPPSSISFDAEGSARLGEHGRVEAEVAARLLPGELAGHSLPPGVVRGRLKGDVVTLAGRLNEPGAPTELSARIDLGKREAGFRVVARSEDLTKLRRVPSGLSGRAQLEAEGTVTLGAEPTMRVVVEGSSQDLAVGSVRVPAATLRLRSDGPLARPRLAGSVEVPAMRVGSHTIRRAELTARGSLRAPQLRLEADVQGLGAVEAQTTAQLGTPVRLDASTVVLRPPMGAPVTISAEQLSLGGSELRLVDGRIQGLGGEAEVAIRRSGSRWLLGLHAQRLDLARIARLLPGAPSIAGRVSAEVDLELGAQQGQGTVRVEAEGVRWQGIENAAVELEGRLNGRRLDARAWVHAEPLGTMGVQVHELELAAGPLAASSWRGATGQITAQGSVALEPLQRLVAARGGAGATTRDAVAPDAGPTIDGQVLFAGTIQRQRAEDVPDLQLQVVTRGLERLGEPDAAAGGIDWRQLRDFEAVSLLTVDGASGTVDLAATIAESGSSRARLAARAVLPSAVVRSLLRGSSTELRQHWERIPLRLSLWVPRQSVARLPLVAGREVEGDVEMLATFGGTARSPRLQLGGRALGLRAPEPFGSAPGGMQGDVFMVGHYDGERAQAVLSARVADRPVAVARVTLDASARQWIAQRRVDVWRSSVRAAVLGLPLHVATATGEPMLAGGLGGQLSLQDWHHDATLHARLGVAQPNLGGFGFGRLSLSVSTSKKGLLRGSVRVEQGRQRSVPAAVPASGGSVPAQREAKSTKVAPPAGGRPVAGRAQLEAEVGLRWGDRLVPELSAGGLRRLRLRAKNFRLAGFQRLSGGAISELDGWVDADATVRFEPRPRWRGQVSLRAGRLQLTSFGDRFDDVRVTAKLLPDGRIHVPELAARSAGGELTGTGDLRFRGARLQEGQATIQIPSETPMPLVADGRHLARLSGRIDVRTTRDPDTEEFTIGLDVPTARVELPRTPSHSLQSLEPAEHVRISTRLPTGRVVRLDPLDRPADPPAGKPASPTKLLITVSLGEDVRVTQGEDLRVRLTGKPVITLSDGAQVRGQIRLAGGTLLVQGKKFTIQRGTVTFAGANATNPDIVVTAAWTAPDGTIIYADFVGPLETGKVTLRAEPARTRDEIVALLLFGTADRNVAAGGDTSTSAVGAAGGMATEGLNRALQDLTQLDVATRVDTSRSSNPAPEIELRIAGDLSVRFAHVLGVPPPGDHPDKNWTSVIWRFYQNWSVEAAVGDKGSSIADLLWQYSY